MRAPVYFLMSAAAAGAVVTRVYARHGQFFPTMVHLTKSNACLVVLANLGLVAVYLLGELLRKVFFGRLRRSEYEHAAEKLKYSVMETFLAMTIFRSEFNMRFLSLYTLLLVNKVFHWILAYRIDFIQADQNRGGQLVFQIRALALMATLAVVDGLIVFFSVSRILATRPSVLLLFAFEASILLVLVVHTFFKDMILLRVRALNGEWRSKGTWVFYLELTTDFLNLVGYMAFFGTVMKYYGLPLHIIRELYYAFRSFRNRVLSYLQYRRIMRDIEVRFPSVSAEDLAERDDHMCSICWADVEADGTAKKLPCNHIYHLHCLQTWMEEQQVCPLCRMNLLDPDPVPNGNANNANDNNANANANANNANANDNANAGANANDAPAAAAAAAAPAVPPVPAPVPPAMQPVPFTLPPPQMPPPGVPPPINIPRSGATSGTGSGITALPSTSSPGSGTSTAPVAPPSPFSPPSPLPAFGGHLYHAPPSPGVFGGGGYMTPPPFMGGGSPMYYGMPGLPTPPGMMGYGGFPSPSASNPWGAYLGGATPSPSASMGSFGSPETPRTPMGVMRPGTPSRSTDDQLSAMAAQIMSLQAMVENLTRVVTSGGGSGGSAAAESGPVMLPHPTVKTNSNNNSGAGPSAATDAAGSDGEIAFESLPPPSTPREAAERRWAQAMRHRNSPNEEGGNGDRSFPTTTATPEDKKTQ